MSLVSLLSRRYARGHWRLQIMDDIRFALISELFIQHKIIQGISMNFRNQELLRRNVKHTY